MTHDEQPTTESDTMVMDALKGAVAGAVGVWVMDRVDWFNFEHEDPASRRLTQLVRPRGLDPAHVLANTAAKALGIELSPPQPHPLGAAIHYAIGMGPGALYAVSREHLPGSGPVRGALYGLGLFVLQDEMLNSLTGTAARPDKYPWQAHARGCVAHVVYGVVTDAVLSVLKGPETSAGSFR